jgi:uncharacterized membrane protein
MMEAGDSVPFCTNCGASVGLQDAFCSHCGTPQPGRGAQSGSGTWSGRSQPYAGTAPTTDFLDGITDRTAAILCYIPVFGVIPAVIFLASRKFRNNMRVRFDGFQSLYLFVAWLIVSSAVPILLFGGVPGFGLERSLVTLVKFAVFICWIYLLVKAAHEEQVRLPVIGDLAARSTAEQL